MRTFEVKTYQKPDVKKVSEKNCKSESRSKKNLYQKPRTKKISVGEKILSLKMVVTNSKLKIRCEKIGADKKKQENGHEKVRWKILSWKLGAKKSVQWHEKFF